MAGRAWRLKQRALLQFENNLGHLSSRDSHGLGDAGQLFMPNRQFMSTGWHSLDAEATIERADRTNVVADDDPSTHPGM